MRHQQGIHHWLWRKSEIITKLANNLERFQMENAFEKSIFNSEKNEPLTWFLKQKYRLCSLHPDMSDSMTNIKTLRKCGGQLEHYINCRCEKPFKTEDFINAMEDIITRTIICQAFNRNPIESKIFPKTSREDIRPERNFSKGHKFGCTSHLANNFTKKTKINEVQVIEGVQWAEGKDSSRQDSEILADKAAEDYPISF
ncbi:hypothetical protein O181_089084 [Austropuccinia psidii MF-1]|uniref:Uncharacterized protein n=1 Tax=Austropuccinia psidii MF-1 TaxID=1389203 RepID=A0A9Q3ISZ1_9BASI|nr:hypothetical protein [Austropuccinia psidii MF-1]